MNDRRARFAALDRAVALAPRIRGAEHEIESTRELPAELAAALGAEGMFRLLLADSFGGSDLELPDFVRVVEAIGEAAAGG